MALVRHEQSSRELQRVQDAIARWLAARDDQPANGDTTPRTAYHASQIAALGATLTSIVGVLQRGLQAIHPDTTAADSVYEQCRAVDQAVVWLDAVWAYFRARLDQRYEGDAAARSLLEAADEVVWSCYQPVLAARGSGSPPLPSIEPRFSPLAWERDRGAPPPLLVPQEAARLPLVRILERLPVALVELPGWCIDAPWWLVHLAHEVGHHVLFELRLAPTVRQELQGGLSAEQAARWTPWADEIFADAFAVAMMGPSAVLALVEVELASSQLMGRDRGSGATYPPRAVRLALAARVACTLGMNADEVMRRVDLAAVRQAVPSVGDDLDLVEVIAGRLTALLAPVCRTATITDQAIQEWATTLLEPGVIRPPQRPETARYVVAGAVRAWAEIVAATPEASTRAEQLRRLRERTVQVVRAGAPPGRRGKRPQAQPAAPQAPAAEGLAATEETEETEVARLLLEAAGAEADRPLAGPGG